MAVYKTVPVDLPGSQELAELNGIIEDLKWVEDACSRLVEIWASSSRDSIILEALSAAALIRYFRCFSSGVRPKLPSELAEHLPAEWGRVHNYYRDVRDKHIAHSVNAFEENQVTVSVPEGDSSGYQIQGLGFYHQRLVSLSLPDVENLKSLAEMVRSALEEMMKEEKAELLKRVQALPIEKLTEKDLIAMRVVQLEDVGKSRRRK